MHKQKSISQFLLFVALLFTVVFQFVHGFSHLINYRSDGEGLQYALSMYGSSETDGDMDDNSVFQAQHQRESCFACDFFISPCVLVDELSIAEVNMRNVIQKQEVVAQRIIPFAHLYFSLRAPPVV